MPAGKDNTVIIIGAGIIGLCVAYTLKKAGRDILILDPEEPGMQCSFGNAGALSSGSVAPLAMPGIMKTAVSMLTDPTSPLHIQFGYWCAAAPWLMRFAASARPRRVAEIADALAFLLADSVGNHQQLASEIGCSDVVRQTGHLHLYPNEQAMAKDRASWSLKRDHGLRMHEVDRAAIAELEPSVCSTYGQGVFLPDEGWLTNPRRYTQTIATALQAMDVTPIRARITSLQHGENGWTASDGSQRWQAGHIVIAAGMGSRALLSTLGLTVPLESQRGYHVQVPDSGVSLSRVVVFADRKVFMTPMEPGLRIAGTVEFAGLKRPSNDKRALLLKRDALAGLQGLNASEFTTWMGHRPCMPDSLPVLGPVKNRPGLWCAFGHGHLGMTGSVNTGHLLARAMAGLGGNELAPFSADRF